MPVLRKEHQPQKHTSLKRQITVQTAFHHLNRVKSCAKCIK